MRKFSALLLGVLFVFLCSPILPAAAEWVRIEVNGISYCLDSETGARFQPPYQGKSDVTKACRTLGAFVGWLDNAAEAASVRFTLVVNPDGTRDTKYPCTATDGSNCKAPAVTTLSWDASCLTTALAPIASKFTGSATSINVRTCLSGTNSAAAEISESGGADWSIASSGAGNTLDNAGVNAGSGSITLTATYLTDTALSASFPWSYQASSSDTTAPNPVTGTSSPSQTSSTVTLEFDSTVDPGSGVAIYRIYKDGVQLDTLTAASPGMVNDFTCAAIGTAGGSPSGMQSGRAWSLEGGGAGLEGTSDNTYQCSTPINGASFTGIFRVSVLDDTAGDYDKAYMEFRDSTGATSVAANCTLQLNGGILYLNSRNRITTGANRASATTAPLGSFATTYVRINYDANGLDCDTSTDGGAWTSRLSNYPVSLQSAKVFSFGCTHTSAGVNGTCGFDFVSLNNVGRLTKTVTPGDSSSHTYTVKAEDVAGNLQTTALAGVTVATTPVGGSTAIKWQPGWYPAHNKSLVKGWPLSNILSDITNEICPNANLKGMELHGNIGWFMNGAAGNYTGTEGGGWGFAALDAVLSALANCSSGRKYLILQQQTCNYGSLDPNDFTPQFPEFMTTGAQGPTSSPGPDTSDVYPIIIATQGDDGSRGWCLDLADSDIRAALIAQIQAYCARYESNPSFHMIGFTYDTSFPFDAGTIDEPAWHATYFAMLQAERQYCPTTAITQALTYQHTDPARAVEYLTLLDSIDGTMGNTDQLLVYDTWGQRAFTGVTGGTDFRGPAEPWVAFTAVYQTPDFCGYWFSTPPHTLATLFDGVRNGVDSDQLPKWPQYHIPFMANECNADGVGWTATPNGMRAFIASISGQVLNGQDNTLRTPASVKANYCPYSRGCQ